MPPLTRKMPMPREEAAPRRAADALSWTPQNNSAAPAQRVLLRQQVLGVWSLISYELVDDDLQIQHPLGRAVRGQLIHLDRADRFALQMTSADTPAFRSPDWRHASDEEMSAAWPRHVSYFGRFSLDLRRTQVVHHIEGSWFPNLDGIPLASHCHVDGDQLTIDADSSWGTTWSVWRRAA